MSLALLSKKNETATPAKVAVPSKPAPGSLRLGQTNDSFEQDADRAAGLVMSGGGMLRPAWSLSNVGIETPSTTENALAPPIVHQVLNSPGQPLEPATRTFFEGRFGRDLTGVRIHTDSRAAESASAVQARAYTVGNSIVLGAGRPSGSAADRQLLAHELVHTLQQERSPAPALQRQPPAQPPPEMKLVDDFGAKFPEAAKLIKPNPSAMKLVKDAFDAGAKFGGFAEDGPSKEIGRAYTTGNSVYVPKNHADPPAMAMRDFLFELNNAIGAPKIAGLLTGASKGAKTDAAAAKKFAYDRTEGEVEGMLRLGEVWFETKKKFSGTQAHAFDQYDNQFYLGEYQSFKDKKKTKDDIVKDVLQRKYDTGTLKGKTVEQFYIEQFQGLAQ